MSILDTYGIKEVANVTFYEIDSAGNPGAPVLFLPTLKVSTIEQTADQAKATGGVGNTPLIIWDYGKSIKLTITDALFSAKSMAIMFGNGKVTTESSASLVRTSDIIATTTVAPSVTYVDTDGSFKTATSISWFDAQGSSVSSTASFVVGEHYLAKYNVSAKTPKTITINADSFPGTYYVTGDTYARSQATGKDEFFQFIVPKAKMGAEHTITLEAEGDPSVFDMSLEVLRPANGEMMKLVQYSL